MANDKTLLDMPKPKRTETLHAAYQPGANGAAGAFADVVVFGTKLEAYEYAIQQDPTWKVAPIVKGQRLSEAV